MDEHFIQDQISNPKRLLRVIRTLCPQEGWEFDANGDLLNQEFNFSAPDSGKRVGGRIDVLATFNNRSRIAIVEVKLLANEQDIEQLWWYVRFCRELATADPVAFEKIEFDKTIGILLAHEFQPGEYKHHQRTHLVAFKFDGSRFPFKPLRSSQPVREAEAARAVVKHSRLVSLEKHYREYLDPGMRGAFDEFCWLGLPDGDSGRQWVVVNPKCSHIAVRYKGRYAVYMCIGRKWFDYGYDLPHGKQVRNRLDEGKWKNEKGTVLADFKILRDSIDGLSVVPEGFDWAIAGES